MATNIFTARPKLIYLFGMVIIFWLFVNQIMHQKLGGEEHMQSKLDKLTSEVDQLELKAKEINVVHKQIEAMALKAEQEALDAKYRAEQAEKRAQEIEHKLMGNPINNSGPNSKNSGTPSVQQKNNPKESTEQKGSLKKTTAVFNNATISGTLDTDVACMMPKFDYFNYDKNSIRQSRLAKCSTPRLGYFDQNKRTNLLKISCDKPTAEYNPHDGSNWRGWSSIDSSKYQTGIPMEDTWTIIAIKCGDNSDFVTHFHRNEEIYHRAEKWIKDHTLPELLNIAVVGMDSTSRAQFYRKLRSSTELLNSNKLNYEVYDFQYYNVLGDGTLKCLVPLLTGNDAEDYKRIGFNGWKGSNNKLDGWRWIWKDAAKAGYVTLFGEDFCPGIFALNLNGFTTRPTDYIMTPLFCGNLPATKRPRNSHGTCVGSRYAHLHHFEGIGSMWKSYEGIGRLSFDHLLVGHEESLGELEVADGDMHDFIQYMDTHFSNNTIVILLGDHGPRYGNYRQTLNGKLEERLPVLFVLVPKWLPQEFHKNLKINTRRLVNAYDLHETVRDVIEFRQPGVTLAKENPGYSLFKEIPKNRTCADAWIELHWCACMGWQDLDVNDATVKSLSQFLLSDINGKSGNGEKECALLEIGEIQSAQIQNLGEKVRTYNIKSKSPNERWNMDTKLQEWNYRIQLVAQPGDAIFEGVINIDQDGTRTVKQVSRISKYSHQETCWGHGFKASFCVCKNWLQGATKAKTHLIFEGDQ